MAFCLALPLPECTPSAYADVDVWDGTLRRPIEGNGTKTSPYLINTSEEFAYLLQNYDNNSGVCLHKYYKLTADLDMRHNMWRYGIGSSDNRTFRAHFDGAGHKIYNVDIYVHHAEQELHAGLFPQLGGDPEFESVIENLEVDNVTLHFFTEQPTNRAIHKQCLAGLVGQMYQNSRVENCIVSHMQNAPIEQSAELPATAWYRIAPLVGDIQENFGGQATNAKVPSARIINSFGQYTPSLGNLHAQNKKNLVVQPEQNTLSENNHKGYQWHKKSDGSYTFNDCQVNIQSKGLGADGRMAYHAEASKKGNFKYRWNFHGRTLPETGPDCQVALTLETHTLSVEVLDEKGQTVTTGGIMTAVPDLQLQTASITSSNGGKTFNVKTALRGDHANAWNGQLNYAWYDLNEGEELVGRNNTLIGAKSGHTYLCVATTQQSGAFALSTLCKMGKPIYVNLNGITSPDDIARYTFDGKTAYPRGNDSNDGSTPETAVRTLQRAIDLLPSVKEGGSLASNVIVIMGDYSDNVLAKFGDQKGTTDNPRRLNYQGKPMLLCGSFGNLRGGTLLASGESVTFDNDIRFENLQFRGRENKEDACVFYAQNNNVTFGYGLTMKNYGMMLESRGLPHGAYSPMFSVFGGFLNPDVAEYNYKPAKIRVLSGYYGRIIGGSRFTRNCYTSGNIAGSPRHPANVQIEMDIHNVFNPQALPFDVGLVLGGQTDGSCYSFAEIAMKGASRVGRIVGGNIGYGRTAFVKDKAGKEHARPSDSYYGKTVINVESGYVNEIYGTSLGGNERPNQSSTSAFVDSCTTYFYGISEINISGGLVTNTLYGAGAGSVTGMMLSEKQHTFDPLIPHTLSNGEVVYGPWEEAYRTLPSLIAPDGSVVRINECRSNINISGKARLRGSVYGGGNAFSTMLNTRLATSQSGNLFGDTHINITGGTIDGYVHGGGRGSLTYYDNHDLTGYPEVSKGQSRTAAYFNAVAQVYGDTHVTVKGGTVKGNIFGGGEGTYYRPVSATDSRNATTAIAAIYGNTHVTIDSTAVIQSFIFGAGNYSNILKTPGSEDQTGNSYVNICGGSIGNSVFGGGHGHYDAQNEHLSVTAEIAGNTYVTVSGGEYLYNSDKSRYSDIRYYNVLGSGRTASIVRGDTYIEMRHSLLGQAMLDSIGMHKWTDGKPWDKRFCVAGGGFGDRTDVYGDTHILIDVEDLSPMQQKQYDALLGKALTDHENLAGISFTDILGGGLKGNVHGSTEITVKGSPVIRNIYGGSLQGECGMRDHDLNGGGIFDHSTAERAYTTRTTTNILSGRIMRVYAGSLMGDIAAETEVNIGTPGDSAANRRLAIDEVYGGNDLTGTIAGSNNPRYGTHINVMGGSILGSLFGSGDGTDIKQSSFEAIAGKQADKRPYLRERPHVASTEIRLMGSSADDAVRLGEVFVGGNNSTVGLFDRDELDRSDLGMFREVLQPNSGRAAINIGSNVHLDKLFMGCNGKSLTRGIPYSTTDGKTWYQGFINDEDFDHFCRNVDMSCVPTLTFNADGELHNNHPIDDRMGDILVFNTPGEMDAVNITMNEFCGGGNRGSMTSDSCYLYTLPIGVTVKKQVVGGSHNAHFNYQEKKGPDAGKQRAHLGGIAPYNESFIRTDRVQLNLFNKFSDAEYMIDRRGNPSHSGAKVFGGCLDYGVIMGYVSLNFHSDILGNYELRPGETWESLSKEWNSEVGYIYAAGKGENTEILGATYINIRGAVMNGEKCIPNCLNVFGGGLAGRVIGRTNVSVDIQCKGSSAKEAQSHAVWGKVYGGGRMGDVCMQSTLVPAYRSPRTAETHVRVYSGYVGEVFGGARMADIENGTWVEINDRSTEHFHTMIGRVFGGSDLSGKIGMSTQISKIRQDTIRTNTYVSITERQHEDGTYSGFPLIGKVFGGGNGEYGTQGGDDHYSGGEVLGRDGITQLAGMALPNIDSTWVEVTGGTIMELYGGANCSNVKKQTHLAIDYGDHADVKAHFDRTASEQCYKRGKIFMSEPFIKNAFEDDGVRIGMNYNICRAYGGNNSSPLLIQPVWDMQCAEIGTIYGGCNQGDVLYYNEAGDRNVNPGAQGAPSLWLILSNEKLNIENVFGGSRMGNIRPSRIAWNASTQRNDTIPVTFGENQYGSKILIQAGKYGRVFGGNDVSGSVLNGTHIMLNGGQVDEVYGAGNGYYTYKWDPTVTRVTEKWDTQLQDYIYCIPAIDYLGGKNATDIEKVLTINEYRPNVTKSFVEVNGTPDNIAVVTNGVFSGGNCSTVVGPNYSSGFIKMDLGDYIIVNNVYLGSNGEDYVGAYTNHLMQYNGISNYNQKDEARGISMLDALMAPVAIYGLPKDFHFRNQYNYGYIGSFYLGGRRGSLIADGPLSISFPRSLKIYDKIVGGPDRAEVQFVDPKGQRLTYEGGVLWNHKGVQPTVNIDVNCDFINATFDAENGTPSNPTYLKISDDEGVSPAMRVYSGCYETGIVDGTINIEMNGIGDEEEVFF